MNSRTAKLFAKVVADEESRDVPHERRVGEKLRKLWNSGLAVRAKGKLRRRLVRILGRRR